MRWQGTCMLEGDPDWSQDSNEAGAKLSLLPAERCEDEHIQQLPVLLCKAQTT